MFVRTNTEASAHWREYNAADFGTAISLDYKGSLPVLIVMKEAGALYCTTPAGAAGDLTGLPAGYMHAGKTATIGAAQTAAIVVYW